MLYHAAVLIRYYNRLKQPVFSLTGTGV